MGTKCYLPANVPIPETDITQLLVARDARAMGMIYDKYGDTLYGVVSRMLNNDAAARDVMQEAFVKEGGIQCGFCSPGMILATKALLDSNPDPTDDEIRDSLTGNLCRCTGYVQIIESVKTAAKKLKETK